MTDDHIQAGANQGVGANGIWVPESARGRTFRVDSFDPDRSPAFRLTEVGDVHFAHQHVIFYGLDGNIRAFHHSDIRTVTEETDRTPDGVDPTATARPTRVNL